MQRFLNWLGSRLFTQQPKPKLRASNPRLRVVPPAGSANSNHRQIEAPVIVDADLVGFDAELGGRIEDAGPGKNVLIRNKYVREDTGTHETLKIIDESIIDTGETAGFDPYNTGQFDRSKKWNTRTRE